MIKIGIFFGGQSREREISFAGGRTVYDNLNKDFFEPIPVFVDSLGNFIQLDWQFIYKGTIRDFYPSAEFYPENDKNFQLYIECLGKLSDSEIQKIISKVGKKILPNEFESIFDVAFLVLHGPHGEDGSIQGLLEWYNIPYTGSGIFPSAIGINKIIQKQIMFANNFQIPEYEIIEKKEFNSENKKDNLKTLFEKLKNKLGLPLVIKSPNQGSSIGVSIVSENSLSQFQEALNKSFFIVEIQKKEWISKNEEEKQIFARDLSDIRSGIGLPVEIQNKTIYSPSELINYITNYFDANSQNIYIKSVNNEAFILIEKFVGGKEFSTIVVQDENGNPMALPPTQIVKNQDLFDYRSKYLPGMSRKITPIDLPENDINRIAKETERLFSVLNCNVYARIDGFFTEKGEILLNDPNTTSGMMPSSFFFHQAAEIGLTPSQFLTYIIYQSLVERSKSCKNPQKPIQLKDALLLLIENNKANISSKIPVAVVMGGYSTERHISVESGRNIFEKLSSSTKYLPKPYFLIGNDQKYELYEIPINMMLKDNADDIKDKILNPKLTHPFVIETRNKSKIIFDKFTDYQSFESIKTDIESLSKKVKRVFIALHGRPGEDGSFQKKLEEFAIPYNGSGVESSALTINKYETNEKLMKSGFLVAKHQLITFEKWKNDKENYLIEIEKEFTYPIIAKPHDDGCSSAVKKIKNKAQLEAYGNMIFREESKFLTKESEILSLKANEEFPQKSSFLIEELISANGAKHFLEITGGMITKAIHKGNYIYETFEPSETLANGEVLSLEEKFLAGEGQNITPSRFSKDKNRQEEISTQVRNTLENVAKTLNVLGYCRIDAFVRIFENGKVETIIIEINSLPGMTPATCIFHQCALNGYKPYDFIDSILEFGVNK